MLASGALALCAGCDDLPPIDQSNFIPQGAMSGTVVYSGPLPCTQRGHVLGAAVLLIFNEDLLPPPEGFGTTAQQLQIVVGDQLFSAVTAQLRADPNSDEIICPPNDGSTITVSAPWTVGPLAPGRWQVRGFYDYDADFSPVLKIHQLPGAGDVGGGAIDNSAEVLQGGKPVYSSIQIGDYNEETHKYSVDDRGALVTNVSVSLGLRLGQARPIFYYKSVIDERPTSYIGLDGENHEGLPLESPNKDANAVILQQDERFAISPTGSRAATDADKQFVRLELGASVPEAERETAAASPLNLQTVEPLTKFVLNAHTNADGEVLTIPEKPENPALNVADMFPQAIFAKLDERDGKLQTAQASPAVIIQGLVMREGKLTSTLAANPVVKEVSVIDTLTVGVRPSVICLNPTDTLATVYVVTPELTALNGEVVVNPDDLIPKLIDTFGNRPNIEVIDGCLPTGLFQTNLVYETGQAWTIPNEAGFCVGAERTTSSGCIIDALGTGRPVLGSQQTILQIAGEREAGYCAKKHAGDANYIQGIPKVCLRQDEIEALQPK